MNTVLSAPNKWTYTSISNVVGLEHNIILIMPNYNWEESKIVKAA